ncbi:MAG: methylglyoxal synthase [Proteobacteria bacterium]|nr:methylglyoxal synthase [Pseudomonadota bacterium]
MKKNIALIAHDACKARLRDWAVKNKHTISQHQLYATGTTGALLESSLNTPIVKFESGPFGGDQQIGARIVEGEIDCLIFFWDPLSAQPHDNDIKALLRLATLWNIPTACNEATGDLLVASLVRVSISRLGLNW